MFFWGKKHQKQIVIVNRSYTLFWSCPLMWTELSMNVNRKKTLLYSTKSLTTASCGIHNFSTDTVLMAMWLSKSLILKQECKCLMLSVKLLKSLSVFGTSCPLLFSFSKNWRFITWNLFFIMMCWCAKISANCSCTGSVQSNGGPSV